MKKLVLVFILIANLCYGQLQNTWMLGHFLNPVLPKCGIDFSNGTADTFSLFRKMPFYITNSIISDSVGQMLFYSNGEYIANRNHDTLLNSKNFNPGFATTLNAGSGLNIQQGVVFLPFESWNSKYTIIHCSLEEFTLNNNYYNRPFTLKYSVLDMNLDNGMGGIVQGQKGITIISDTLGYGKITACRHANGRDWWVLSRKFQADKIYKILVTPDTIISSSQNIGSIPIYDVKGQAEFSPDGSKYAMLTQNHMLDLYDFDRCTGLLYNQKTLNLIDTLYGYYGCSFSSNSRYLYANTQVAIYQFDLWSSNIDSTLQTVALWDTVASPFPTLFSLNQLAVDGKIYIGTNNGCDVLHCINAPDSAGVLCNVLQNKVKLPSRNSYITNYPNYGLGALTGTPCDTLTGVNNTNANTTQLNLFPNPATNYVNITYQFKTNEQALFTLYNSMGQEVVRKTLYGTFKSLLLHTNTYNSGMYYYKVVMKNIMVQTGKLVIGR